MIVNVAFFVYYFFFLFVFIVVLAMLVLPYASIGAVALEQVMGRSWFVIAGLSRLQARAGR